MYKLILRSCIALMLLSTTAYAAILEVPDNYTTVPEAITAAQAGDIVQVATGEYDYASPVIMKNGVKLRGTGPLATSITCDIEGATDSTLENLAIYPTASA